MFDRDMTLVQISGRSRGYVPRIILFRTKGGKRVCRWVENQRNFPEPGLYLKSEEGQDRLNRVFVIIGEGASSMSAE